MAISMRRGEPNRKANIWTARFIPLLLVAIIAYSTWVVTKLVCIDYLVHPPPSLGLPRRTGAAIAILVIYYILLTILLLCYARLVYTVISDPGVIPRGAQWHVEEARKAEGHPGYGAEKGADLDFDSTEPRATKKDNFDEEAQRLSEFYKRDVFVCQYDGRPTFCSSCYNWKVDRSHHCKELDRCVYKMDHFCPWVGGIVSETSFKYFIQFTFWTALFCLDCLVVMAFYFAERSRRESFISVHWILVIAFAALFLIFGVGMCGSSLQFAFENTSTIENIDRRSHVWYLAIHIPNHLLYQIQASPGQNNLRMITYPRPPEEQLQLLQRSGVHSSQQDHTGVRSDSRRLAPSDSTLAPESRGSDTSHSVPMVPAEELRTFAILGTQPGDNPFFITYFENFKEVMGYTTLDWLFPLRPSPCTRHDSSEAMYKMGQTVYKMRRDAGILDESEREKRRRSSVSKSATERDQRRRSRKRRKSRSKKSQSGNSSVHEATAAAERST